MYWNFIMNDEEFEGQYDTAGQAQDKAEELLCEECEAERHEYRDGETVERVITLIQYDEDAEGDTVPVAKLPATIEWVCEKTDFEEHNTLYKGGCV